MLGNSPEEVQALCFHPAGLVVRSTSCQQGMLNPWRSPGWAEHTASNPEHTQQGANAHSIHQWAWRDLQKNHFKKINPPSWSSRSSQLLFLNNKVSVPSVVGCKNKSSELQGLHSARSPSLARWVTQEKPLRASDLCLGFEECAIKISCS